MQIIMRLRYEGERVGRFTFDAAYLALNPG